MTIITLSKSTDASKRIETLTLLYKKSEDKVKSYVDTFRQRNMNYALVVFAGYFAVVAKSENKDLTVMLSCVLFVLMVVFCFWDRKWHRVKHGWDYTSRKCYDSIVALTNNPNQSLNIATYYPQAEKTAEKWKSPQPLLFYFLVLSSFIWMIMSFTISSVSL